MNCLECRRVNLAEPNFASAELQEHANACALCAEFLRRSQIFEEKLAATVNVPVDSTLASRILLNRNIKNHQQKNWFAMAASVVAAVGITLTMVYRTMAPDPALLTASVEHVIGEPGAMKAEQKVSQQEMVAALELSGAKVKEGFTNVTYLHDCPVPGGFGKHIVMQTAEGKVTLITMPSQKLAWSASRQEKGFMSAIYPAKIGSYAVVADSEKAMHAADKMLKQNVIWRT